MAYQDQFYTVGTVTVTGGSTAVTGAGTGWETALIVGGVFYAGGGAYPIQFVSSETELTLAIPYVGVDAAGVGYAIDRQRAAAISNIAMNDRLAQIIREISIGNIEDLNVLELVALQVIGTDAAGKLTQSPMTAAARALLNISGAAGANKFAYLTDDDEAALTDITQQARAMLASATPAITSLGFTPINRAGGAMTGTLALRGTNTNTYQLDSSQSVVMGNNTSLLLENFSGFVIVNSFSGGWISIWLLGGGIAKKIGETTSYDQISIIWDGGNFRYGLINQSGAAAELTMTCIRTRPNA